MEAGVVGGLTFLVCFGMLQPRGCLPACFLSLVNNKENCGKSSCDLFIRPGFLDTLTLQRPYSKASTYHNELPQRDSRWGRMPSGEENNLFERHLDACIKKIGS